MNQATSESERFYAGANTVANFAVRAFVGWVIGGVIIIAGIIILAAIGNATGAADSPYPVNEDLNNCRSTAERQYAAGGYSATSQLFSALDYCDRMYAR